MTHMVEPVTWSDVVARFDAARNAWFGTVDPAGGPHSVPIWTASVDEVLYVFGERRSVKFRNLAAFAAKYAEPDDVQWLPEVDPSVDLVARIEPSVALLWSSDDYFGTKRRWQAP